VYLRVTEFEADAFRRKWAQTTDRVVRRRVLRIFGQDIREKARKSIKPAKPRPDGSVQRSAPGTPPRYRAGNGVSRGNSPFIGSKNFVYVYDDQRQSVVVGPRLWRRRSTPTPNVLEYGGTTKFEPWQVSRYRERRLGGAGEIRVAGMALGRDKRGRFLSARGGTKIIRDTKLGDVWVAYAKLRTVAQVRRSREIQARLFLGTATAPRGRGGRARVSARPFMRPTLAKFIASSEPIEILGRVLKKRVESGARNLRARRR
jgi:hypothetical protein